MTRGDERGDGGDDHGDERRPGDPPAPPRWRVRLLAVGGGDPVAPAGAAAGPVAVAAAGGAILAAAEGRPWPAVVTPFLALLAHLLVDRARAFHLPVLGANLLGLGAAGLAVTELGGGELEARLLFGAHLLVYLTWIVLLQRKTFKVCWSLIALAVLQVAVAAVLTAAGSLGLALLAFLGLSVGALANLNARWPTDRQRRTRESLPASPSPPASPLPASTVEPGRAGSVGGGRLLRTVGPVCGTALLIGLTAFLLTPRVWLSRRPPIGSVSTGGLGPAYTGFTGEVRLGAIGEILESREAAFEVEIEQPRLGRSLRTHGVAALLGTEEPLFRGRTLDEYEDGRWSDSRAAPDVRALPRRLPRGRAAATVARYRLRPVNDRVLFALSSSSASPLSAGGSIDAVDFPERPGVQAVRRTVDGVLLRPTSLPSSAEVEYVVAADPSDRRGMPDFLPDSQRAGYLQRPGPLPAVAAASAAALADLPAADDAATARRLTAYLRDSGRFAYSLDLSVEDPTVDAVEDFLANKRRGHCEYFATALALMLRDRGVPSRIVTGFKGGEYDAGGGRLVVEQRHAHAWVEAYVGGRWETFDATPAAARAESVEGAGPRFRLLADLAWRVEGAWNDYVVRMNLDRQRSTFLGPFRQAWEGLRGAVGGLAGWEGAKPVRFDGAAGAVVAAGLLGLVAAGWAVRGLLGRTWRRRRDRRARAGAVAFWRRFAELAARRGVTRAPSETPAEFAPRVAAALADVLTDRLAGLPGDLAADLYAVRFGETPLSADRTADLTDRLDRLEVRLSRPG